MNLTEYIIIIIYLEKNKDYEITQEEMIIFIALDAYKASDKIQQRFLIKVLKNKDWRDIFLTLKKKAMHNCIAKVILNGKILNALPLKSGQERNNCFFCNSRRHNYTRK